jgi:hypothetical protein
MDEITLFAELAPAPPDDIAELRTAARARLAEALRTPRPAGRQSRMWARRRGPRRRSVVAAALIALAACAAVIVPLTRPGGTATRPAVTTAWVVHRNPAGTVTVTVRQLHDPVGLQRALRGDGIPAYVRFVPEILNPKGSVTEYPACTYVTTGPPLKVPYRLFNKVFSFPPAAAISEFSFIIHTAAIPAGTAVLIDVEGPPPGARHPLEYGFGSSFQLIRNGHLGACVPNNG